jgi:TRAP-type mannitol/chloroaromatic compound transport system permease large subunit
MTIAVFTFSLLGAMALGMPIAFALLVCGIALMHSLGIFDSQIVAQNIINGADSFPLMAVPFFMLAGEIMNKGGLAKRIVDIALAVVGHVPGGLDTSPSLHPVRWRLCRGRLPRMLRHLRLCLYR